MSSEFYESRKEQDTKFTLLETNYNTKHQELSSQLDTKFSAYDTIISESATLNKTTATQLDDLKEMVHAQAATISELQELVLNNDIKATKAIKQVLTLANGIEAHQRRWALRILGMDAPPNATETTEHAKHLVLDFVKDSLLIDNVRFEDIDCAHRIGRVVDNKQTMLIRCFSRDLVQIMLKNRFNLKDTPYVLYEDSPLLNRLQLQ